MGLTKAKGEEIEHGNRQALVGPECYYLEAASPPEPVRVGEPWPPLGRQLGITPSLILGTQFSIDRAGVPYASLTLFQILSSQARDTRLILLETVGLD